MFSCRLRNLLISAEISAYVIWLQNSKRWLQIYACISNACSQNSVCISIHRACILASVWAFFPSSPRCSKSCKHEANVKRIQEHFVILERLIALFIDQTVKQKPSAWPCRVTAVIATSTEPWPAMNYCLWYGECWQFNHSTVSIENSIYLKRWYCFPSKWQPWQMGQKHRRRLNKEMEREPAGSWASCSQPRMMNRVWLCLTGSNITIHSAQNTWSTLY